MLLERLGGPPRRQGCDREAMGCPKVGPLPVVETTTMLDPLGRPGGAETIADVSDNRQSGIERLSTGTDNAPTPSSRSEILGNRDKVRATG